MNPVNSIAEHILNSIAETKLENTMDTYHGHVKTPQDAIKLFEACRLGLLPRVQRRLSEKERQLIKSGSVFVWDEREAGMRRWTDGKSWSASRVAGSFLTYREMEGKRGGGGFSQPAVRNRAAGTTPDSGRGSDEDHEMDDEPDGYRYKPDGLMKQSFSITTSNSQHLHLISYYARPHPGEPPLPQPSTDPALRHINPPKGMYPESTVGEAQGPAVTRAPMQQGPYMHPHPHHRGRAPPYSYPAAHAYESGGWPPPSPVSTPPYPYPPQMYHGLPPPPQTSHTPYQHHNPHQHHSPQPHHNGGPYHHQSPHQPMQHAGGYQPYQTGYDRPPPPHSDSSLPPPPPDYRGMGNAPAQNHMPPYAANPNSRGPQGRLAEQSSQVAQRALQSAPMLDPRLLAPSPGLPPVQMNEPQPTTLPPVQQFSAMSNGGPRSSTPPTGPVLAQMSTPTSGTGRPSSEHGEAPQTSSNSATKTSQAQTIPSISSLVHPTDSISVLSDNRSNSSRQGSGSPKLEDATTVPVSTASPVTATANGTATTGESTAGDGQRPKDIPHSKLGDSRTDVQAIRSLDRSFCL